MVIAVMFKRIGLSTPPCGTPRITLYDAMSLLSAICKRSQLHEYMRRRRPEDLNVEHIASWYTQSYANVISRSTTIADTGLLYAISNGNDNIPVLSFSPSMFFAALNLISVI